MCRNAVGSRCNLQWEEVTLKFTTVISYIKRLILRIDNFAWITSLEERCNRVSLIIGVK
jgi:hypothetical protein